MQVICFYWEGDRWQSKLNGAVLDPQYKRMLDRAGVVSKELASAYVNNLFEGVSLFMDREFDFICFTNESLKLDPSIQVREFPFLTKRGVLPRLYMFSKESGLWGHQVLCLDIDVVVVGDMNRLTNYNGLFCARSKFKYGEEHKLDGDIMSFKAGPEATQLFWEPFITDIDRAVAVTQGRERYWMRMCANDIADRWDQIAPGAVVSYKRHMRGVRHIPPKVSIVSFHGYPRPHQATDSWVQKYWKGAHSTHV